MAGPSIPDGSGMEASDPAKPASGTCLRFPESPDTRHIPASDPHPPAPAHTFHAGDRRFESGWGYYYYYCYCCCCC
jgi:hypothetical protein